jgi:hypothetical protein
LITGVGGTALRLAPSAGAVAMLAAWYVLQYGSSTELFFHLDDFRVLGEAGRLSIPRLSDLFAPGPQYRLLYRPLSELGYFWPLQFLFGHDAAPYHAVQLCAHVANAVLVYVLAGTILGSRGAALAVALLYAAAPGHATAVYWLSAFSMTGTAFWYFACLLAWLRLRGWPRRVLCPILLVLGLLTGEAAISLPLALTLTFLLDRPYLPARRAYELLPMYLISIAYGVAKIWYFRLGAEREFPEVLSRAYAVSQYQPQWAPAGSFETLGFYGACALSWLYRAVDSPALLYTVAGAYLVALGAACLWARHSASGRVVAFGLSFFIVGLGPMLPLPQHRFMYLVGIAAFGSSLALVAAARAVPRIGSLLAAVLVGATLLFEALWTSPAVRDSGEFRFQQRFQARAAGWLQTVEERARRHGDAEEVLVTRQPVTHFVFELGEGHRLFYGATYDVKLTDVNDLPASDPDRVVVAMAPLWRPGIPLPGHQPRWDWLRWMARLCIQDVWAGL